MHAQHRLAIKPEEPGRARAAIDDAALFVVDDDGDGRGFEQPNQQGWIDLAACPFRRDALHG